MLDPVYTGKSDGGSDRRQSARNALTMTGRFSLFTPVGRLRCLPTILMYNLQVINAKCKKVSNWFIESLPYLLKGAVFTLQLSIGGMFFWSAAGICAGADADVSVMAGSLGWRAFISRFFRGTPLIAQLFMIYYGLPQFWD
ncbi:ABC transporter membrane protein [Salmonella enterica subsp. enterica]|uniref:ABC transporter membrane protein n=1 Tax=Salmonella enterica I TaxID=59201 RepID=A0A447U195_SALET|nr:ABC transporter membrane protein [Salmonella enterica subsp. enterica]